MRFIVKENRWLTKDVLLMRLCGDTRSIVKPGQFVQIALPGFYLRRPISVCDWQMGEEGSLTLIYKVVGHGTEAMSLMEAGTELDLLTGLGNGFDLESDEARAVEKPLLVGGGVGVPPMYGLCKKLVEAGKKPVMIMGFGKKEEIFWKEEFEALGVETIVTTIDGSEGVKGFVTDAMKQLSGRYDGVMTCGPEPMLKAVYDLCQPESIPGWYSFEERMACGFGVCMGCSCQTKYGNKRICKDGPVMKGEEIIW
ncbi:MAG: dihydroorotate dehydrogenase electron transfer subunit [Clostridiales bacterium]|nr:dihydroorotate dehydrogenase electron transfer subunit [Clostridiales bacterium]